MKALINKIIITMTLMVISVYFGPIILAASNDYSVTPILPENQNPNVSSYFDLTVTPNQNQNLQLKVRNNTDENQKYKIYVNTAITNQNGIIDYSVSEFDKVESMEISLKECINLGKPQIEVPANSEKKVLLELNVPVEPFKGIVLGGVTIEPIVEEGNEGVGNVFTRTLAIQLSESSTKIVPKLKGGRVSVSQENLRNNVKFELQNSTPTIISKIKAEIAITKKGHKMSVLEQTKEQLSFAPNSKFNLMTEWNQQFEPGKYVYRIHLNDEEGNNWIFTKDFKIKEEESEKLNQMSVDEKKSSSKNYFLYIVIIFVILSMWIISKKIKKNKVKARG